MKTGMIFEIKEFAIHDGPGIRTTVFLKGCTLDCTWCHNPEGKSYLPQLMRTEVSERLVGKEYTSKEIADRLNGQADIFQLTGGGVTFSGGEPILQTDFIVEVIDQLESIHTLLDTSGYGNQFDFLKLLSKIDMVYYDLKIIDQDQFYNYTGGDNQIILDNLQVLSKSGVPFVIRVPLVPGVTDTKENLTAIVDIVKDLSGLTRVDLLPYNQLAGAKYESFDMVFEPNYNEKRELNTAMISNVLGKLNIPWSVV